MSDNSDWQRATARWYSLPQDIMDKAGAEYKEGIKGHGTDLDYCAAVLMRAIDNALDVPISLSAQADEYEEAMKAEAIMEDLR